MNELKKQKKKWKVGVLVFEKHAIENLAGNNYL